MYSSEAKAKARAMKKVELHVHLDGAMRPSTLFELGKRKKLLKEATLKEFTDNVTIQGRVGLTKFLKGFAEFMPCVAGDREAIRRISYEFCEDMARDNIIYSETRYCPQLLCNSIKDPPYAPNPGDVTPDEVVKIVTNSLEKGQKDFNVKVRSILCCIREAPDWSEEILCLCQKYKDGGVVAIDIAGDENICDHKSGDVTQQQHVTVFQEAQRLGIHRTVHAGENGPAESVAEAVTDLKAERIGHGYHTLDDLDLYKVLREKNIHFETCPLSSYCTESVSEDLKHHPLIQFVKDKANCSVSSDDPCVIGSSTVLDDYVMCIEKLGLNFETLQQLNLNAARSSFLPATEKTALLHELQEDYGLQD